MSASDFLSHCPAVERHLAALLLRKSSSAQLSSELAAALALLGLLRERGDLCVPLEHWGGRPLPLDEAVAGLTVPSAEAMEKVLAKLPFVSDGEKPAPLVLKDGFLYLWRFYAGEQRLAQRLASMVQSGPLPIEDDLLRASLIGENALGGAPGATPDWQSVAVHSALRHRLCVITGGPGTGKTTVVLRVLRALLAQDPELDVALAAPTGKAAARMSESMRGRLASVPEELRSRVPEQVQTLHRLLGYMPRENKFRHRRQRPLPQRLLIVDEVSMVDLELMLALVEALRGDARLILLGDADQLASVGAGAVLRELCLATDPMRGYSAAFAAAHLAATGQQLPVEAERGPLGDSSVRLRLSHRFREDSGIGQLAEAVRAGDADSALDLLRDESCPDLEWITERSSPGKAVQRLGDELLARATADDLENALGGLSELQILCALRRGPYGVEGLGAAVEELLRARGVAASGRFYRGRPILVTHNDRSSRLSNGDIGVAWPEGDDERVAFAAQDGVRMLAAARLPEHEPAWALTIHKSQGSEYDRVWVVLPPQDHPMLCAELLYTAITRARQRVTLHASEAALRQAIGRRTERASTLATALGGG